MIPKKIYLRVLIIVGLVFLGLEIAGYAIWIQKKNQWKLPNFEGENVNLDLRVIQAKNISLKNRMRALLPKGMYLVIDTGENKSYLKKGNKIFREAVVSCGSGEILEEPGGERKWVFDTP